MTVAGIPTETLRTSARPVHDGNVGVPAGCRALARCAPRTNERPWLNRPLPAALRSDLESELACKEPLRVVHRLDSVRCVACKGTFAVCSHFQCLPSLSPGSHSPSPPLRCCPLPPGHLWRSDPRKDRGGGKVTRAPVPEQRGIQDVSGHRHGPRRPGA